MDKFLTYEGEQPIWLDDFNFIDKSVRDTFSMMVSSLTGSHNVKNIVLSGCEITRAADSISWTDGIVCLDGEILPIKAGQIQGAAKAFFNVTVSYDSAGDRTFKSGEKHSCYELRTATLTKDAGEVSVETIDRLRNYIGRSYFHVESESYLDGEDIFSIDIIKISGGYFLTSFMCTKKSAGILSVRAKIKGLSKYDLGPGNIYKVNTYFSGTEYGAIVNIIKSVDSDDYVELFVESEGILPQNIQYSLPLLYLPISKMD